MTLDQLDQLIALRKKLRKLDKRRAAVLRALRKLGIDSEKPRTPAPAAPVVVKAVAPARPTKSRGKSPPEAAPPPTPVEAETLAIKRVLAGPYAAWQKGEIDDEDWRERKARFADQIKEATAEILAGPPPADPCTICEGPSTLVVMGDPFCAEHRPRPTQVTAA
jgi:hypothetical protein